MKDAIELSELTMMFVDRIARTASESPLGSIFNPTMTQEEVIMFCVLFTSTVLATPKTFEQSPALIELFKAGCATVPMTPTEESQWIMMLRDEFDRGIG